MRQGTRRGFTLIELMIVVAVVGILAAIAIPKFAGAVRTANEGATKGNLGAIRSALSIYYGDLEGQYPSDLDALTTGAKYLASVPPAKLPSYHPDLSDSLEAAAPDDTGGWVYDTVAGDARYGRVWVNCTHTDARGSVWTAY
jgi:general secretion pathway protein G